MPEPFIQRQASTMMPDGEFVRPCVIDRSPGSMAQHGIERRLARQEAAHLFRRLRGGDAHGGGEAPAMWG